MPIDPQNDRQDQFARLVAEHRSQLFGYLYALVQNLADTEDLFQETCLVLWNKFDQFEPGTDFAQWAFATAHFEALNFYKRSRRSRLRFDDATVEKLAVVQSARGSDYAQERAAALANCMEKLVPGDRELVEQFYAEKQPLQAVADARGQALQTVYNALSRVRRRLYDCIARTLKEDNR